MPKRGPRPSIHLCVAGRSEIYTAIMMKCLCLLFESKVTTEAPWDGYISCLTTRVRPLNLGWCFLPPKVASDTPFLGRLWTDLAKILVGFLVALVAAVVLVVPMRDIVHGTPDTQRPYFLRASSDLSRMKLRNGPGSPLIVTTTTYCFEES